MIDWLIIGISGVTCSGKTSLSNEIHAKLPNSVIINQDDYFLPMDSPLHTTVPELNHINFDIMSSLDMQKMHADILKVIQGSNNNAESCKNSHGGPGNKKLLIVEGFLIFSYKPISDLCNLRYFITLSKEVCWERRKLRTYEPPDVPGYFDKIVWPEYLKHKSEILNDQSLDHRIEFVDGSRSKKNIFDQVYGEIKTLIRNKSHISNLDL